jgi:hypothetical protein
MSASGSGVVVNGFHIYLPIQLQSVWRNSQRGLMQGQESSLTTRYAFTFPAVFYNGSPTKSYPNHACFFPLRISIWKLFYLDLRKYEIDRNNIHSCCQNYLFLRINIFGAKQSMHFHVEATAC